LKNRIEDHKRAKSIQARSFGLEEGDVE